MGFFEKFTGPAIVASRIKTLGERNLNRVGNIEKSVSKPVSNMTKEQSNTASSLLLSQQPTVSQPIPKEEEQTAPKINDEQPKPRRRIGIRTDNDELFKPRWMGGFLRKEDVSTHPYFEKKKDIETNDEKPIGFFRNIFKHRDFIKKKLGGPLMG